MFKKIAEHPVIAVISGIIAVVGVVAAVLGLTQAEYALVTDGEICGYSQEQMTTRPHQYHECENPNKITGYRFQETVSKSSGRVGGGYDQNWHCENVKREKETAVGQSIVWGTPTSSEDSNKDWKGKVTYKYFCSIPAKWGPIYAVERWAGCGEADPVVTTVSTPKTCFDESRRIGWKWQWE